MNARGPGLAARVRSLLTEAIHAYQGRPSGRQLAEVAKHLDGPLRVAIAGRVKAGKSTLVNALIGTSVAATDAGECTKVVTWYSRGRDPHATAHPHGDVPTSLAMAEQDGHWTIDLGGYDADRLNRIEVVLASEWLDKMSLVDTPGMDSLTEAAGKRTQDFLGQTGAVDAVLYLLRHLHSSDVDFLDTFHEASAGGTSPVNAVGVLSRADEIGGGLPDALQHAKRVAAEYRNDSRIRGLVHTVLPVAGLLAEAAAALTEADVAQLREIAAVNHGVTDPLLVSARRFTAPSRSIGTPGEVRERLLGKFGLYGVRYCLDVIRHGEGSVPDLRRALHAHSGLAELRGLLLTQFTQRRDVLKADGALRAIETVIRADPTPAAPRLRQSIEKVRSGAHELAELRLLTELRIGAITVKPALVPAMERVLGGAGTSIAERVGVAPQTAPREVRPLIDALHRHWTRVAQNPLTDPTLARAAQVIQRTCEGMTAAVLEAERAAAPRTPAEQQTQIMHTPSTQEATQVLAVPPRYPGR